MSEIARRTGAKMTVAELIDHLLKLPGEAGVFYSDGIVECDHAPHRVPVESVEVIAFSMQPDDPAGFSGYVRLDGMGDLARQAYAADQADAGIAELEALANGEDYEAEVHVFEKISMLDEAEIRQVSDFIDSLLDAA